MNLISIAMVMALTPAPVAPELVALGDSYAAGTGAGNEASDSCRQSPHAFPRLWAERNSASLVLAACAGARTADVARQAERIKPSATLVTITAGGNDAGFADVMTTCTTGDDEECVQRVGTAETFIRDELPGRLDALYGEVDKRTSAKVVVLGYPRLFSHSELCLMSEPKRNAINRAADVMAEVTAARAEAAGFGFADVRRTFDGHGVCSGDAWVNGLVLIPIDRSYHPNRAGHERGYLPALTTAAS
ncbi:lysophospholipase L1-like esterase [Saccharothrix ecbatanensis]|uniref:Lysophospholipase L1-like esterase n=1 Tax=Saccharothrix ecbatanensis TaxID=1105145 RepID=A0A7W9HVI6_9PSEU|nr:SGNH/GDSL hydrolase family protein [Saccharothrix ecbatanensis]MBB5808763.1 lysophospholipase L1-like esterase [Saccharothrix ecbatanensis]